MAFHRESDNAFSVQDRTDGPRRRDLNTLSSQDENESDLTSIIEERLKNSSVYAVAKIGQSQSKFKRIMWLLVLMIGLTGFAFQIYRFLNLYFKYPIIVNLEAERNMVLEFPALTVCSLSEINAHSNDCVNKDATKWYCKEVTVTSKPIQILKGYKPDNNPILDKRMNNSIIVLANRDENKNHNTTTLKTPDQAISNNTLNKTNKYPSQRQNSKYTKTFNNGRSENYLKILNTKVFIQNCFFNGESCSAKYFNRFRSLKYGDCYTFKSVDKQDKPLRTFKTGLNSGLELDLSMEYGYNVQSSDSVGARLAIHDRTELPDLEGNGISINAGFETSISLRQSLIHRLPAPYKDRCVNYGKGNRYNQTDQNDCVYFCIQEWNEKICGCANPSLQVKGDFLYCDATNVSQTNCMKFIFESETVRETCDCPLPCVSKNYNEVRSQALWPAENSRSIMSFQAIEQFRRSHARVKVYYSTLERSIFHQEPMFQQSELFSHLGGELGLWLGLSLIALFEAMETFISLLKFLLRCCWKPKKELFY